MTASLPVAGLVHSQPLNCDVKHQAFVQGGVAKAHMRLTNDGHGCALTFKFGGSFEPSEWQVDVAPKHGRVEVSRAAVTYFPVDGYAGPDRFVVKVFGSNPMLAHGRKSRNGSFDVVIDVQAAR